MEGEVSCIEHHDGRPAPALILGNTTSKQSANIWWSFKMSNMKPPAVDHSHLPH